MIKNYSLYLKEEEYDRLKDMYGPSAVRQMMMNKAKRNAKIVLNVSYKDKNEAKLLGAKWDNKDKTWYIVASQNKSHFSKWLTKPKPKEYIFLTVPYKDKDSAKNLGALWNNKLKKWYIVVDKNKPKIPNGIKKWMTK